MLYTTTLTAVGRRGIGRKNDCFDVLSGRDNLVPTYKGEPKAREKEPRDDEGEVANNR